MKFHLPVVDTHIHVYSFDDFNTIKPAMEVYEQYTLLSSAFQPETAAGNLSIAAMKKKYPDKIYGYASFHRPQTGACCPEDLLRQAKMYYEMGFDGIKMLDGKPTIRKASGVPLDDKSYDPMFSFMEDTQFPILYHINDPVEFWDEKRVPEWARKAGYLYDSSIPSAEQIKQEAIGILKKHPKLNLTIAHFFFLSNSDDYELACSLMEQYENLFFDVTPGWEMFEGFGRNYDKWRGFISRYADRIVFGTDICRNNWDKVQEPLSRCLETADTLEQADVVCSGLALEEPVLKKIYRDTYKTSIQPDKPKEIKTALLKEYVPYLEKCIARYHLENREQVQKDIHYYADILLRDPSAYPI